MKELKQLMKDVVLHNIGIKVLSLIGALFVWLIIINIDDPYKTKVFQVPVETINESALQSVNKVFEITPAVLQCQGRWQTKRDRSFRFYRYSCNSRSFESVFGKCGKYRAITS